ncbi:MAG: helix-turn-helix domain-containing protein [Spirochaetaceae bacterium]|jgi:transcriptional regulator with XRE-family HTH domain|nr:helix-turn-helix domain-containing protein [Spirochaetaceae bacterium]
MSGSRTPTTPARAAGTHHTGCLSPQTVSGMANTSAIASIPAKNFSLRHRRFLLCLRFEKVIPFFSITLIVRRHLDKRPQGRRSRHSIRNLFQLFLLFNAAKCRFSLFGQNSIFSLRKYTLAYSCLQNISSPKHTMINCKDKMMTGGKLRTLLGQNIKLFRSARQISQAVLAEEADISIPFLSEIERGQKWPQPDNLAKIALALNVEVYDLFKPEKLITRDVQGIISKLTNDITKLANESITQINTIVKQSG